MAAVGGLASIWGAAFGVASVLVLKEVLRAGMHDLLRGAGGEHELIAYGVILVLIMIFMPQGLVRGVADIYHRWQRGGRTVTPLQSEAESPSGPRFHLRLRR